MVDGMYWVHEVPQPLDDVAAATIRSAMPFPALRSCRLTTTSAPQDSNSSLLSGWARPVSQPSSARTPAPFCESGGTSRTGIRMGSLLDDAPARALHLCCSRKLVAVAVSGMVTASAARSGLVLDEDSNCMGGAIGAFFQLPTSMPLTVNLNKSGHGRGSAPRS